MRRVKKETDLTRLFFSVVILILSLSAGVCLANEPEQKKQDVVKIQDANLEKAIRDQLSKPTGDLFVEEIEEISYLRARNLGIETLAGLEKISQIHNWDLSKNKLMNVDGLKSLSKADKLSIDHNRLVNVDGLKNLSAARGIYLTDNHLSNLDGLENLKKIRILSVNENQLRNVDGLKNLSEVHELHLAYNQLSNVDGLKNLTAVKVLSLEGNELININGLGGLVSSIIELDLGENRLSAIDALSELTRVKWINLSGNQLRNVDGLKNLKRVERLYLSDNCLENVDGLQSLKQAESLNLSGNRLTEVDGLSNLDVVGKLNLQKNKLKNLYGLENLEGFKELRLGHNHLYPVDTKREVTETARKNKSFVEKLTKKSGGYVYDHPNEFLDVSVYLKKKDIRRLTEEDLSFKAFAYGMSANEIESTLGAPSQEGSGSITYYNDGVGVNYFNGKARVIYCLSQRYATARGIKVGDSIGRALAIYGEPDVCSFEEDSIELEYYVDIRDIKFVISFLVIDQKIFWIKLGETWFIS